MKTITITKEANDALRKHARGVLNESCSVHLPDGQVRIQIDEETLDRLQSIAFAGESFSDTILRAVAAMGGKAN